MASNANGLANAAPVPGDPFFDGYPTNLNQLRFEANPFVTRCVYSGGVNFGANGLGVVLNEHGIERAKRSRQDQTRLQEHYNIHAPPMTPTLATTRTYHSERSVKKTVNRKPVRPKISVTPGGSPIYRDATFLLKQAPSKVFRIRGLNIDAFKDLHKRREAMYGSGVCSGLDIDHVGHASHTYEAPDAQL